MPRVDEAAWLEGSAVLKLAFVAAAVFVALVAPALLAGSVILRS